jgi:hypothetical protein
MANGSQCEDVCVPLMYAFVVSKVQVRSVSSMFLYVRGFFNYMHFNNNYYFLPGSVRSFPAFLLKVAAVRVLGNLHSHHLPTLSLEHLSLSQDQT